MKEVYSTGEAAKLLNVAPRTVAKWFDAGRIRGYRVPGIADRRIPREMLIRFMQQHGLPLPPELAAANPAGQNGPTDQTT